MNISFTTEETCRRADEVVDYLRGPRLWIPRSDYPDFDDWLERAHSQMRREEKMASLAIERGKVVGAALFQRYKSVRSILEVKNLTVRPESRGRLIASFLLRIAEIEASSSLGCSSCVIDAKSGNLAIRKFLIRSGYSPISTSDLYGLGSGDDVTYSKEITRAR